MSERRLHPETLALHAGHQPDCATGARAVPIYQTTSYTFEDTRHAADLFALKQAGYIYTRIQNPTTEVLENRLAALHGAPACVCTASGMAAIFYTVATLCKSGDNIVSGSNLYGGTVTLFGHTLPRFGITTRFVDTSKPEEVAAAIDNKTKLLYLESIGNPRSNVDDFAALAKAAHDRGVAVVMDATVSPPPMFDPMAAGADIVVYSLTKIIGGHGTSLGGAIVDSGRFDWGASPRYADLVAPDESYHGLSFYEAFCQSGEQGPCCLAFGIKVRVGLLRDTGAAPSPFNSFLILQGLETLPLRAQRHCQNAMEIARFLQAHEMVSWVNYSGLPGHPDHQLARQYFPLGPGAVFGFGVKGGIEAGKKFIDSVKLCSHLANILDAKTLVIQPAATTHSQLSEAELQAAGVSPDMVRISVGIEHVEDIKADLDQALMAAGTVS